MFFSFKKFMNKILTKIEQWRPNRVSNIINTNEMYRWFPLDGMRIETVSVFLNI